MLRATHAVLKAGAVNCFYVIASKLGLTDAERRRLARRDGNEHIGAPAPYEVLMKDAGFVDVEVVDVTPSFIETIRAWKREWEADSASLIDLLGEEDFSRRIRNRILDIGSAEDGLLHRYLVQGRKS